MHDVGQVVATAGGVGTVALGTAVLVKLVRVLLLAPMVTASGLSARRSARDESGPAPPDVTVVPLFIVGFLLMAAVRSFGLVPDQVLDLLRRCVPPCWPRRSSASVCRSTYAPSP